MSPKIRLLGDGYEPHVDEIDGRLIYSLPVESSFVTLGFEFEIQRFHVDILKSSVYRYSVFYVVLHTLIQNTFGPSLVGIKTPRKYTQEEFDVVAQSVLSSSDEELAAYIVKFNKENKTSVQHYVDEFLKSKTKK